MTKRTFYAHSSSPSYSRRRFLGTAGKSAALTSWGIFGGFLEVILGESLGQKLTTSAAADIQSETLPKPDMIVHSENPFNGEFPPHLLRDPVTPIARHFVRNNGDIPERAKRKDLNGWRLTVDGAVGRNLSLSMDDLLRLPQVSLRVVLECAGNGRSLFEPKVGGTPWNRGAVGCSEWTGIRLRDVLNHAGLKPQAVYLGNYGEDSPPESGEAFSRGIPIEKAMDEHTLIAFKMNGQDLPAAHGFPARLIVPGWIGSAMQKWLNRIWVRERVHDSEKMSGYSYRVSSYPAVPGNTPAKQDMEIATSWIVKSLITTPQPGVAVKSTSPVNVGGHAWAGENKVDKLYVSDDYGVSWREARLQSPMNRYAWYTWESELSFENRGYYEIWARAFDDRGDAQPFRQPWNPKGYLGNVIHRVPVLVDSKG
ncbi:MAG: sulfite oxidase [Candidatus Poribacteria bacterium]|nr:sulfite oxidase [Candidatus Poribacteria bacterium]